MWTAGAAKGEKRMKKTPVTLNIVNNERQYIQHYAVSASTWSNFLNLNTCSSYIPIALQEWSIKLTSTVNNSESTKQWQYIPSVSAQQYLLRWSLCFPGLSSLTQDFVLHWRYLCFQELNWKDNTRGLNTSLCFRPPLCYHSSPRRFHSFHF